MDPMSLIALASTIASIYGGAQSARSKEEYQDKLQNSQEQYAQKKKQASDKDQLTSAIKRSLGIKDAPVFPGMESYKAPKEPNTDFYDTMQGVGQFGASAATSKWAENAFPAAPSSNENLKDRMRRLIEAQYGA